MASNKFIELQEFSDDDLRAELTSAEKNYKSVKFDHAVKGLDNPLKLREMRRDVARLKTEVRRREVAGMTADEVAGRSKIRFRRRKK